MFRNAVAEPLPQPTRMSRLHVLDRMLERAPDAYAARFERAGLLREQGQFEEAKADYLELIRRKPDDFAALNDFGAMVLKAGYSEAARSLFTAAVRHHPDNPNGHVNLANLLLLLADHGAAQDHFEAALRLDPDHIHAHRGIGNLLAELGDELGARRHRDRGFAGHAVAPLPYRGPGSPIGVLLLVSAAGGNIPTSALIDERVFQTTVLVAEYAEPDAPLPPHDVVFNGIGDADLCRAGLEAALAIVARSPRPVINHPRTVLRSGRAANAERLRGLQDVVVPRVATLPRQTLLGSHGAAALAALGLTFPLLLRSPGFHTGLHFIRVETAGALSAAAAALPGEKIWAIEQLDARDDAGMFRKYRVMIIDRQLYPLHLALSRDWKVHYFTADMADRPDHRALDAAFLQNIASIGKKGIMALHRLRDVLELDYGGVDFALNAAGEILFFEANATMLVQPPLRDPKWAYRGPAVEAVLRAATSMLRQRAACRSPDNPPRPARLPSPLPIK
jgi:Tetratricopeptide repeat